MSWPVGCAVASGLIGAIGVLWRIVLKGIQDTQQKLEKCEKHHGEQSAKVEALSMRFAHLEGRMEERHETAERLDQLEVGLQGLPAAVLQLVQGVSNDDVSGGG